MNKRTFLATAASIFAASTFVSVAQAADVHCGGTNACKGQSACKGAANNCKGQNSCKGQGFSALTKEKCDAAKGKYMPS